MKKYNIVLFIYDNGSWKQKSKINGLKFLEIWRGYRKGIFKAHQIRVENIRGKDLGSMSLVKINGKIKIKYFCNKHPSYSQAVKESKRKNKDIIWDVFPFESKEYRGICHEILI